MSARGDDRPTCWRARVAFPWRPRDECVTIRISDMIALKIGTLPDVAGHDPSRIFVSQLSTNNFQLVPLIPCVGGLKRSASVCRPVAELDRRVHPVAKRFVLRGA